MNDNKENGNTVTNSQPQSQPQPQNSTVMQNTAPNNTEVFQIDNTLAQNSSPASPQAEIPSQKGGELKSGKLKKKQLTIIIIIVLVLAIIATGSFILIKSLSVKPKTVYEKAINASYEIFNKILTESDTNINNINFMTKPSNVDITAKLTSNIPELKNYTNLDYHILINSDLENKRMQFGGDISQGSAKLLEALLELSNNRAYLRTNVLNKIINLGTLQELGISIDDLMETVTDYQTNVKSEDMTYLLNAFKNALIESLDEKKLSISNENITIGTTQYKAKKSSYLIDKENATKILKALQNKIANDDKLLTIIANLLGLDEKQKADFTAKLGQEMNLEGYKDTTISLYTDSKKTIIAGKILVENVEVVTFDYLENNLNLKIALDNLNFNITSRNNLTTINVLVDGNNVSTIIIEDKENSLKLGCNVNYNGLSLTGVFYLSDQKMENDTASGNYEISLEVNMGTEKSDFKINGTYSIAPGDFKTFGTNTNSVRYENLSKEDISTIYRNLKKALDKVGIKGVLPDKYESYTIEDKFSNQVCASVIEEFYRDNEYYYTFNCTKSSYVVVTYIDGSTESIKEALAKGHVTIDDLKENNIAFNKTPIVDVAYDTLPMNE